MLGKRQYSLGYLLLLILWWAVALGVSRGVVATWNAEIGTDEVIYRDYVFIPGALVVWPIAIGGTFGRMTIGAAVGVVFLWLSWIAIPARGW